MKRRPWMAHGSAPDRTAQHDPARPSGGAALGNKRAFEKLPVDMRAIVTEEFDASAMQQRDDIAKLSVSLRKELEGKGITFIEVDRQPFREALSKTTFYKDWKAKFGEEAWSNLEKFSGKLV
jgi:TRAP-type C4-dicarboxylate transport system substrate-binding protein